MYTQLSGPGENSANPHEGDSWEMAVELYKAMKKNRMPEPLQLGLMSKHPKIRINVLQSACNKHASKYDKNNFLVDSTIFPQACRVPTCIFWRLALYSR
jgi:hypothetical protein